MNIPDYILERDKCNFREVICPHCGAKATANTGIILTSYPPKYNVDCPNCGRIYMECNQVNII